MISVAQRLRQKLLDLAIHGKLVPQCAKDEPAGELLARIRKARNATGRARTPAAPLSIPEEEIPFDLPRGWVWCRLGEIFDMHAGKHISADEISSTQTDSCPYPCYGGNGVRGYVSRYNAEGSLAIVGRQGALCGNVQIASGRFYATEHAVIVDSAGGMEADFVGLFLTALNLNQHATATAQPGLSVAKICEEVLFPLPPLTEQKRIVEKLNAMLKEATRVAEGTERLALLRKKARAKILDLAIRGKLVTQEKSDEPAAELLKRIATEKAKLVAEKKIKKEKPLPPIADDEIPFELPKGWAWARWGDLSLSIQYGYNAPAKTAGRIKMVRITDIQNGKIIWDGVPYCEIPDMDIECYELKIGDILFARTGGTVGKSHLVADVPTPAVYAGYLIRTRCSSLLNPEYFKYFMESTLYWSQLRKGTIATAQPNCNGQTLSKMIVPLPPLAEQQRIVAKVKEMLAACDAFGGEG